MDAGGGCTSRILRPAAEATFVPKAVAVPPASRAPVGKIPEEELCKSYIPADFPLKA
jgi:hypothetical protein